MKILVLLAGVMDPKWPIAPHDGALPVRTAERLVLSPFDEAALEMALQLRDGNPEAAIRAVLMGGAEAERLARSVAAFNLPVATIEITDWWDPNVAARSLAGIVRGDELVLLGREFGDCDGGVVPSLIAALRQRPFFARSQAVRGNRLMRETADIEEWVTIDRPLIASVTNDRRNRLRKPLMKNVMMARQAAIDRASSSARSGAQTDSVHLLASCRLPVPCSLITGSADEQAARLAELLS